MCVLKHVGLCVDQSNLASDYVELRQRIRNALFRRGCRCDLGFHHVEVRNLVVQLRKLNRGGVHLKVQVTQFETEGSNCRSDRSFAPPFAQYAGTEAVKQAKASAWVDRDVLNLTLSEDQRHRKRPCQALWPVVPASATDSDFLSVHF